MKKVEIEIKAKQNFKGESTIEFKVTTLAEIGENATLDTKLYAEETAMALIVEQSLKTEIPRIVAQTNRGSHKNAKGGAK